MANFHPNKQLEYTGLLQAFCVFKGGGGGDVDVWAFKLSFGSDILVFFGHFFQKLGVLLFNFLVTLLISEREKETGKVLGEGLNNP